MSSSALDCGWNSGTTGETPLYIQSYSFATKLWENKFESGESGDGIYVYLTRRIMIVCVSHSGLAQHQQTAR